jgi:GT2 family glycosyltransferase
MNHRRDTFSVLICTYNRPAFLRGVLSSLVSGGTECPDEIVVVNGGDERANEVVRCFQSVPHSTHIRLVQTVNRNLAVSRNVGLRHCDGEIIAMTDDDAEVFPDWVAQMKRAHREHPEAGAVGGAVIGADMRSIGHQVAEVITFPSWSQSGYVRTLPGVNISYKRSVVERVGQQDEDLFRGEDVDYNWRVKRLGYEIYFDPAIRVHHHHRRSWRGLVQQQYMYGRGYYLVRRKWPDMYCIYPHRIRKLRDILKVGNVAATLVYQPLLSAIRLPSPAKRVSALPLLFVTGVAWKTGMLVQAASTLASGLHNTRASATGDASGTNQ